MNAFLRRRAAVGGGALTVALGVGLLAAPAANALDVPGVTTGTASGVGSAVSGVLSSGSGTTTGTPSTGTVTTPSGTGGTTTPDPTATTTPSGTGTGTGTTTAPDPTGTVGTVSGAVSGTTPAGGVSVAGVTLAGSTPSAGTGTGILTGTGGGGTGVTVGAGGTPVVTVTIGGSGSGSISTGGSGGGTAAVADTATTTTSTTQGTTATTPGTSGGGASTAGTPARHVLSLAAAPSIDRVYPMKDGYRDDVLFRLASTTADGAAVPVDGHAVLRRGAKTITRWRITSSDQALRWNGRDHARVVPGTYAFTATVRDASGTVFTTSTSTVVSAKRLVPATTRLTSTVVSGTHRMAAAPRKALSTGTVRLRITTVASRVKGTQRLVFEKGDRRIVVPVKQGTHTTRTITVPKDFTSFTLRHTWRKGAVQLQKVRYSYSYSSLR